MAAAHSSSTVPRASTGGNDGEAMMSDGFGDQGRWQIAAGDLQLAYAAGDDDAMRLSGLRVAGREWANDCSLPPWALPEGADLAWTDATSGTGHGGTALSGRLAETGLTLAVSWQPD